MKTLNTILAFILIAVFSACSDGGNSTNVTTVDGDTIVIDGNTLPTAIAQELKFLRDSVDNTITLSGLDADGDSLSYTLVTPPRAGTLGGTTQNPTYTPDKTFFGWDSFTYTVSDGSDTSDPQTIDIYVRDPAFVTLWNTINLADDKVFLTTDGFEGNYTIDWGDGHTDYNVISDVNHTYARHGANYVVRITGDFPAMLPIQVNSNISQNGIMAVLNWGDIKWKSMRAMFAFSTVVMAANDVPDLSQVTDMSYMFMGSTSNKLDISNWDTSNVTNMTAMFQDTGYLRASDFSDLNTSNVTEYADFLTGSGAIGATIIAPNWGSEGVYHEAPVFSKETAHKSIHLNPTGVDQGSWTSSGETFTVDWGDGITETIDANMTSAEHSYPRGNYVITVTGHISWPVISDIGCVLNWGDVKWERMDDYFLVANNGHTKLYAADTPDLSNITDMSNLFAELTSSLGSYIGHWDVSTVKSFSYTFGRNGFFDQNLSRWDTSSATSMDIMFWHALSFTQDLSNWDVSNVTNHTEFLDINSTAIEPTWVY